MSSEIFKKPLPYIALILAHLIWGVNFVVAKIALNEFPPMSLAFSRFALAVIFLAPFFLTRKKDDPNQITKINKKDLPKLVAVGVLIITLNIAFFFEGIKRTTAIDASILSLTIPMLSVLFGWWFLKEKVHLINLVGIALGFSGALIIIGLPQIITGTISLKMLFGNTLIVLASIAWVAGATISKKILDSYSSILVIGIAFLVGTITFFIPASIEYIQNPNWISQITILGILGLLYMALLSSVSAYFLFEWGLSKTSIIVADLFQYIEPFAATFLAITFLGETLSASFLIGSVLIVIGVFLGTFAKEAHHRHRAHSV